jgi:hypothetical protein
VSGVKREVVGIVGISLIAGLWVTLLLIGGGTSEKLRLVSAEVPERFDRSVGSRPVFSIGLTAERKIVGLGLHFAVLHEADPLPWMSGGRTWVSEEELVERPTGIAPLDIWLETGVSQGVDIPPLRARARVNGTDYDAYIFDFRDLSGPSGAADVFALLFSGGNLSRAYWGHSGFFPDASTVLASVRIEHDQESLVYSKSGSREGKPLVELPPHGVVSFPRVERDDQILVTMILEGHLIPTESSWLWVCATTQGKSREDVWVFSTM